MTQQLSAKRRLSMSNSYALFFSQLNRKTKKTFKTDGGHTNSRTAQEAK